MLNILHISDLHFTSTKTGLRRDYSLAASRGIVNLAADLRSQGLLSDDAIVAITGDLVQTGAEKPDGLESDFEAVEREFLKPLQEALSIGPDRFFLVPGNHELDRDAVDNGAYLLPYEKCCEADAYDDLRLKLSSYFDFVEKYKYNSVTRDNPRLAEFSVQGQKVFCFNGLVGSYSRKGLDDKGHLFHLSSEMVGPFGSIDEFAVLLTHHPLSWFYDESEVKLREFFSKRRVRILSGHIHSECIGETGTQNGGFVTIQAGASSEGCSPDFSVGVSWLPKSNSAACRQYIFDETNSAFKDVLADETQVSPQAARAFFERTEAFFDPSVIAEVARNTRVKAEEDLLAYSGVSHQLYVAPDLMKFEEDLFSGKRATAEELLEAESNVVVSGHDLSGKSSLLAFLCLKRNTEAADEDAQIGIWIDFRELRDEKSAHALILRRLTDGGASSRQAEHLLSLGKVRLFVDNVDPNEEVQLNALLSVVEMYQRLKWTFATRGGERFMPSRAPAAFSRSQPTYYQTSETTLPTVLKLIEQHEDRHNTDKPRAVVEQVFRSIHNLSAPRSMFYVSSLLDIFLSDASVEPLNRYLLIENLISERIRGAHREVFPGQPVDIQMLDAFIGQFAFYLLKNRTQLASKAQFLTLVESFIDRKGLQKKRFDPEKVLEVLVRSHVVREYSGGYGFIILSIEDYFLAKHMSQDDSFRETVLTEEGLLTLPAVAEYYVAQNPNDRPRIDTIFKIIDAFEKDVRAIVDEISESSIAAIKTASPGKSFDVQGDLLDSIAVIDEAEEASMLHIADPVPVGQTKRFQHSTEERGAILLQLGASILGVTRTLDQDERVKIFHRLKSILLICIKGVPMIAQHLADGHEVRFRGVNVKAEYIGKLAIPEDRYYLLLRSMLHNLYKRFSTWSGSPSFYESAVKLRRDEDDEMVATALLAQNIEADLAESLEFIPSVTTDIESLVLREIVARLYLDAMTLVPLERADEARGIDRLVDLTAEINPPSNQSNSGALKRHKDRLRRHYSDKIGLNTYIGKRMIGQQSKRR